MVTLNYIPGDGYTEPGYCQAEQHVHGEFRFRYRPVLTETRSRHLMVADKLRADQFDRRSAAILAEHVTEWSLVDAQANPVPISAQNVLRLKPTLFNRLYMIVFGIAASDTDPEWSEAEKEDEDDAAYESAVKGADAGAAKEAAAEKNCGPG